VEKAMRQPMVAGNWKMNGSSDSVSQLVAGIKAGVDEANAEVVVCPPFIYIPAVAVAIAGTAIKLGAQNMCDQDSGAYTGEVAGSMLKDLGCEYVIIGHSERRQYFGETDATVNKRVKAALKHGLTAVVCVGETLEQREENETFNVIKKQVQEGLKDIKDGDWNSIVIACC